MTNKNNTTLKLLTVIALVAILVTACAPTNNATPPATLTLEWKQGTVYKDFQKFSEQSASEQFGLSKLYDRPQHVVLIAWLTHRAQEGLEISSNDFTITDPYDNAPGKELGNTETVRGLFFVDVNNLNNTQKFEGKLKVKQVESTFYLIGVVFSLPCRSGLVRSLKINYTGKITTHWVSSERAISCGDDVAQSLPTLVAFAY